jgi:hypothetical protein
MTPFHGLPTRDFHETERSWSPFSGVETVVLLCIVAAACVTQGPNGRP